MQEGESQMKYNTMEWDVFIFRTKFSSQGNIGTLGTFLWTKYSVVSEVTCDGLDWSS